MKVVLHPGMTKAGSTSIQRYFGLHVKQLSRVGIGYVEPQGVAKDLVEQTLAEFDRVRAQPKSSHSYMLVSHESLFELREEPSLSLLEGLAARDCQVRVVVVVRPISEWAVSIAKQRLKSLRGFRAGGRELRVERWFETWTSPSVVSRLAQPVEFMPLASPSGLIREFVARSGLPMPHDWATWKTSAVNRSPGTADMGIYAALNEAIATVVADPIGGREVIETPRAREVRGLLGRLLSGGDHHRRPKELGIDEEFRVSLLGHFVDDLEGVLLPEGIDDQASEEIREALAAVRRMLKGADEGNRLAQEWSDDFVRRAQESVPSAEDRLRSWCMRSGRRDIAAMMLPT